MGDYLINSEKIGHFIMADAHTSMYMKSCESTQNCDGSYTILLVKQVGGSRKQVVQCNKCKKEVDRFVPA